MCNDGHGYATMHTVLVQARETNCLREGVAMTKRVRIALELDEAMASDLDRIVERMNENMAPLQMTRAAFIRAALKDKMAKLKAQVPDL